MKIIIGLGNPEEQHQKTRHNAGFLVVDELARQLDISLENSPKLFSLVGKNDEYILAQPQIYMNDSGRATQALLSFFKLTVDDLIIIHDDLDISFGEYKVQQATGPKAHNGLLSIYEALGTNDFMHVRIGVEARNHDSSLPGKSFVLQEFLPEEESVLQTVIGQVSKELLR